MRGLVIKGIGGFYYVKTDVGVIQSKGRGLLKKDGFTLAVGDNVEVEILADGDGIINSVYPRKNHFIRPPIANIDSFVVVVAATKPKPNYDVIDKFLITAEKNCIEAVLCVNKCDIASQAQIDEIRGIYENVYQMISVSGKTGKGVDALLRYMAGKRTCFAGPSGVGKSTITNLIIPDAAMETGNISEKTSRGRHTTRHVEIFQTADGGMVFDTPGFTSFDISDIQEDELSECYPEIADLRGQCRFENCRHMAEPGCRVREAAEKGRISQTRYQSYLTNMQELKRRRKY